MSLFKHVTNSNGQGDIGMGYAIAYYTKNAYTVCIPLTDSQEFDLIVVKDSKPERVQVKTSRYKPNNNYVVDLNTTTRSKPKNFDNKKVDKLFVVVDNGTQYDIPSFCINTKTCISLGSKYDKYII
jgi:hypothetical protein